MLSHNLGNIPLIFIQQCRRKPACSILVAEMKCKLAVENLCYPRGKTSLTNIKRLNSLQVAQVIQLLPTLGG